MYVLYNNNIQIFDNPSWSFTQTYQIYLWQKSTIE